MTWNEFKKLVDESLARQGYTGEVNVFHIDTGHYPDKSILELHVNAYNELRISW